MMIMVLVSLMKLHVYKSYEIFVVPLFREVLNSCFVKSQVFVVSVTIPQNVYWFANSFLLKGATKKFQFEWFINDSSHKMIQLKYAVALLAMCVDPNRDNKLVFYYDNVSQHVLS